MDWIVRQAEANEASKEQATEWINERTFELLKEDAYNPSNLKNFVEAIDEASDEKRAQLREYLENRDFEKFGRAAWCIAFDYMEAHAEHHAEMEYSR